MRLSFCVVTALALLVLVLAAGPGVAQEEAMDWKGKVGAERFGPMAWLEGEWQGYGEFPDRTNYARIVYSYDLAGIYLVERTVALFPPPEPTTDYEIHQDFTVYYRNSTTGGFTAKSFFIEAYVVSSTVEVLEDGSVIVVESTDVENGPPGMRSRTTISREGDDAFALTFEIAMPGKDYSLYEEMTMRRVR